MFAVAIDARRPVDRRDGRTGKTAQRLNVARGDAGGNRSRWFMAQPLPPTRCWSARERKSRCSPPEVYDVEMREALKPDRYDLRSPPPEPLVPRERQLACANG